MSKSAKSIEGRKAASTGRLWLRLSGLVREALYETVIGAGLAELMSRGLRELPLVALLIDGVHFAEHVVLAAVPFVSMKSETAGWG